MPVVFSRVEERLIHGQITVAWANVIDFDSFVIVDDVTAHDEFLGSILEMSVPNGKKLHIYEAESAAEKIAGLDEKIFLLAKSPVTFSILVQNNVKIEKLNIGSTHFKAGKKEIYKTVYLSDEEIAALKEMIGRGIPCEIQKLPTESKKDVASLLP